LNRTPSEIQADIAENAAEQKRQDAELGKEAENLAAELVAARNDKAREGKISEQRGLLVNQTAEVERCRLVVEQLSWLISEADQEIDKLTQTGSELQERVDIGIAAVRANIASADASGAETSQSVVNDASQALAQVASLVSEQRRRRDDTEAQMEPVQYALNQALAAVQNAKSEIDRLVSLPEGSAWTDASTPPNTERASFPSASSGYSDTVRAYLALQNREAERVGKIRKAQADAAWQSEVALNPTLATKKGGR
jgi:hypothetical protein